MAFRLLRKIKYTLFILFIICLVTVFYLTSMGLPNVVVRRIEPYLQFSGMVLDLDKIKLSIFEGIVATSVRYFKKGDVGEPVIQAEKVVLKFDPLAWIRGDSGISGVIIKNGRAQFALDGESAAGKLTLDDIHAHVLFDHQTCLKITSFATTISGLKVSGQGTIIIPRETTASVTNNGHWFAGSGGSGTTLQNIPDWLNSFTRSNTVNLDVNFFIDPDNLEKLSLKVNIHGRDTTYNRIVIGAWSANISVNGKNIDGTLALKNAEIEGLVLQSVSGLWRFDEKGLITGSLKSTVGQTSRAGPVAMQFKYNSVSEQFEGQATTGCDFRSFVPLLRKFKLKLADIFEDFDFKRSLPSGDISFKGELKPAFSCRIKGEVLTDTVSFKQVPTLLIKLGFDAELFEAGEKVTIRPLLIVRDEGLARGHFVYDSDGETITFSIMSMADPQAIAAMIDPSVASALKPYSFDGLCYITALGTVGITNSIHNDAEINFNASDVHWKMFRLAPCSLTLHVLDESYKIDDFNGSIYHGTVNGSASVDPVADSTNMLFAISAHADNVDFGILVNAMAGKQLENAYEGTCSASISLQGLIEDADGSSIKGDGWIKIENGRIFTVPIFSGLFDIIGKVIPGVGTFNGKNHAQATITVENGKVHGSQIYIDGDVFSLKGSGDVYLDGRLDFKAQITFMRRHSLIGNLVQIITLPLTKAFEFHLGGTVSNPKWEAAYWPF